MLAVYNNEFFYKMQKIFPLGQFLYISQCSITLRFDTYYGFYGIIFAINYGMTKGFCKCRVFPLHID